MELFERSEKSHLEKSNCLIYHRKYIVKCMDIKTVKEKNSEKTMFRFEF